MVRSLDHHGSALLVVDTQVGVLSAVHDREGVLTRIGSVVEKARAKAIPVVWIQDTGEDRVPGSQPWKIVPELEPRPSETQFNKTYGDAFEETPLTALLTESEIGRVYVVGAQTDACIRSTLHGAFVRGYDTVLISDAHTTEDLTEWGNPTPAQVIAHTNLYWQYHTGPGRAASVISAEDVAF